MTTLMPFWLRASGASGVEDTPVLNNPKGQRL
jgi:hypothetical protein